MTTNDPWLLPEGIEEVLPPQAERLELLRRHVLDVLRGWGYELVMPPFIDYLDSLLTGTGNDLDPSRGLGRPCGEHVRPWTKPVHIVAPGRPQRGDGSRWPGSAYPPVHRGDREGEGGRHHSPEGRLPARRSMGVPGFPKENAVSLPCTVAAP